MQTIRCFGLPDTVAAARPEPSRLFGRHHRRPEVQRVAERGSAEWEPATHLSDAIPCAPSSQKIRTSLGIYGLSAICRCQLCVEGLLIRLSEQICCLDTDELVAELSPVPYDAMKGPKDMYDEKTATESLAPFNSLTGADDARLAELGYRSEFKREFSVRR